MKNLGTIIHLVIFVSVIIISIVIGEESPNSQVTAQCFAGYEDLNLEVCSAVCIPKCCGMKEVWDMMRSRCEEVQSGIYWQPSFYELQSESCAVKIERNVNKSVECYSSQNWSSSTTSSSHQRNMNSVESNFGSHDLSDLAPENLEFQAGPLNNCSAVLLPFRRIGRMAGQRFRLLLNGSIILRNKYGVWHQVSPGNFCIDGIQKNSKKGYEGDEADTMIWLCQGELNFKEVKKGIPIGYAILLFGSSSLLLITAVVYFLLWKQNGVYEWLIVQCVISNLFMIVFVATGHSIARNPEDSDLGSGHCIFIGASAHFFFLASFTWTFIICFELWWTFRKLCINRKSVGLRRLAYYQLPGWGVPAFIVSVGLTLDKFYGLRNMEMDCPPVTTPNYGLLNCYLCKPAQGPYLFYPIGVIIACNLFFFFFTIFQMQRQKKSTKAALQGPESGMNKSQSQLTTVFAKLFVIMGLSWIFALVAWLVSSSESQRKKPTDDETGVPLRWIIYDIVITVQALAIFLIFTWKTSIFFDLWRRYPCLRGILKPFTLIPSCRIKKPIPALSLTSRRVTSIT